MMLPLWRIFTASVLVISMAVHVSTFFGVNPIETVPGVMLIHGLISPPFVAVIFYSMKLRQAGQNSYKAITERTPRWMQVMMGVFCAYAMVNFFLFMVLNPGGIPQKRVGKYVLLDHGKVISEFTEEEYQRHSTYVVRGYSGLWMFVSFAALRGLTGVAQIRLEEDERLKPSANRGSL